MTDADQDNRLAEIQRKKQEPQRKIDMLKEPPAEPEPPELPGEEIPPPDAEYAEEPEQEETVVITPTITKTLSGKPKNSFIDAYKESLKPVLDTPMVFVEASGLHILSAVFSGFIIIPQRKMIRPNLFFLLSSVPGRTRRSTLAGYDGNLIDRTYNFYVNTIKDTTGLELPPEAYNVLEEGSIEGLMDDIDDYRETFHKLKPKDPKYNIHNSVFHIDFRSTEFGDVLSSMGGEQKSYLKGMARLLSKLFYGEGGKISLSSRGSTKNKKKGSRYLRKGTFATMFAMMQKAGLYLDIYLINQGLLRRVILICKKADRYNDECDEDDDPQKDEKVMKSLSSILEEKLCDTLVWFEKSKSYHDNPIVARLDEPVRKAINAIGKMRANAVDANEEDMVALFRQSEGEMITKLATLYAFDDGSVSVSPEHPPFIYVKMEHFNKAKKFYDEATADADEIIRSIGYKKEDVKTSVNLYNSILTEINSAGSIGKTELLVGRMKLAGRQYQDAILFVHQMIEIGIVKETQGQSTGGRPTTILSLNKTS